MCVCVCVMNVWVFMNVWSTCGGQRITSGVILQNTIHLLETESLIGLKLTNNAKLAGQ